MTVTPALAILNYCGTFVIVGCNLFRPALLGKQNTLESVHHSGFYAIGVDHCNFHSILFSDLRSKHDDSNYFHSH